MREKPGTTRFRKAARLALALSALVTLSAGTAAAGGRCVTAMVPWDFELPDGSIQPAGSLTLCLSRVHDPVTGLHEVRVGRRPVGLFMSRFGAAESAGQATPVVVFEARGQDRFRLAGYAWAGSAGLETYRFYDPRATRNERLMARAPLLDSGTAEARVLLAALPERQRR